ncbi:unnamed protein product [Paramecium sonneborni]|uniref:Uncharacterized protein n=1 Tax=Paramecium sonneborni TaxID=65129 RepID=A0A8S1K2N2_9CILI|nr:unnamed protein product [Paramecium sonneborni]
MNEQLTRMEKEKNNRSRLLHKIYAQKQKAPFNNISIKIRVQNMIKQIQFIQNERSRCKSEFENNKFPYILRLNPLSKPQNIAPLNLRLNTIRTNSRKSNLIMDETTKKGNKLQQASLDSNLRLTSSPQRFDSKYKNSIQTLIIKDTSPVKEQHKMKIEQQTQVEFNLLENISSWSRKSSESIF